MKEQSVSTKFQADLRKALPGCEVIKHADKSMIGMVDASITFNKLTIWAEYKFVMPKTKGVEWRAFLKEGIWTPEAIAAASPTQFETAKRLATAGHCCYIFWVLDHNAIRMKVGKVVLWHPLTGERVVFEDTAQLVDNVVKMLVTKDVGYLRFTQ